MKSLLLSLLLVSSASVLAEDRVACLEEYLSFVEPAMNDRIRREIFPPAPVAVNPCEAVVTNPTVDTLSTDVLSITEQNTRAEAARRARLIERICDARQNPDAAPVVAPVRIRLNNQFTVNAESVNNLLRQMHAHIDANPTSKLDITLSLNSGGGSLGLAQQFIEQIRRVGNNPLITIRTEVPRGSDCDSACTLMFVGGEHRIAHRNVTFGFHKATLDRLNGATRAVGQEVLQERSDYWIEQITRTITDTETRERVRRALENSDDLVQVSASRLAGYVTDLR